MTEPNNTETKPLINNDDIKSDISNNMNDINTDTQTLLNNDENKSDIILNINNSIQANESIYESKNEEKKMTMSLLTDISSLNTNVIVKEGKLIYRRKFWSINCIAVLMGEGELQLYNTSDTARINMKYKYNVNPRDCIATIKEDSKTSFYILNMSKSKIYEFKAENEEDRLDWISKINQDEEPKKLLAYLTLMTEYDAFKKRIKTKCDNCGFEKPLFTCLHKKCHKHKNDSHECHGCYKRFHNSPSTSHPYKRKYMVAVDNSKYDADIQTFIEKFKAYTNEPMILLGTFIENGLVGGSEAQITHQLLYPLIGPGSRLTGISVGVLATTIGLGVGALAVFAISCIRDVGLWYYEKITPQELRRRCVRSLVTTVGISIGTGIGVGATVITSAFIGAIAGSPIPVIGHGVGIVVGLICGFIIATQSKKRFDKHWWPSEETKFRQDMLENALTAFGLKKDDIKDPKKFNLEILKKLYHSRAKDAHPDTNDGDHLKFIELCEQYGILIAEYNKKHKKIGKIIEKTVKKAIVL